MRRSFRHTFSGLLAGLTGLATAISYGATLTVTNLDDSGPGSLRDRIAAANSGDTIVFSVTGAITLSTEIEFGKNLNISGPGANQLTVQAINTVAMRLFHINSGTITIAGLTLTKGKRNGPGSGIYKGGGTLTLNDCVLSNNFTQSNSDGGGIYNENGNLTLNGCLLSGNSASGGSGGAIYSRAGTVTLFGCTFTGNSATIGGGVSSNGPLTVNYCTFTFNTAAPGGAAASGNGGAIENFGVGGSGTLVIETCIFSNNRAFGQAADGGAINTGGNSANWSTTVSNSTFNDNSAGDTGGAIANLSNNSLGGTPTVALSVTNCTFSANKANAGGAIANTGAGTSSATTLITSCTFSRNGDSAGNGNGVSTRVINTASATLTLRNTILQKATGAGAVNIGNIGGTISSQGYNVADDGGSGFLTGPGDQINADAKLDPAGLQYNGGLTPTFALIGGSAAIDRGSHFGITVDQRGVARPINNPSIPNAADGTDVGAYESPADPVQDGSSGFVVTTVADHDDGVAGVADCTLREAIARTNFLPGINTITFAPAVTGTITLQPAAGGQLNITDGVSIIGPGARILKISAFTQTRVFAVSGNGTTTISGLTIADGWVASSTAGDSEGGGIYNLGALVLVDCTVDFNRALGGSGFMTGQNGGSGRGGAIFNAGALTLTRCTLQNNRTFGGSGAANPGSVHLITVGGSGGDGRGGGVYNQSGASLAVSNCTFANNGAGGGSGGAATFGGNGGHGLGGAIFNLGTLDISAATVSANYGDGGAGGGGTQFGGNGASGAGAGGIAHGGGTSTLRNSIVAGNESITGPIDVSGAFVSGGFNLISRRDGSSGFNSPGDQSGTNAAPLDPQLSALANNGGPTNTMAPMTGSPALDRGNAFGLATDQRGIGRPVDIPGFVNASGGDGSDIGAVELTPILVTTVDDHDDGSIGGGDCTLREAINAANARSGDDTIAFAAGVTGTIQLGSELPQISTSMVIAGPGANVVTVRRNTAPAYRIFVIANPPQNDPVVTISGLTIANGLAPNGGTPIDSGGGIINDRSKLTVRDCVFTGNSSSLASFSYGGAIMNNGGHLTVDRCTLSANTAYYGGGIANRPYVDSGVLNIAITNSTFAANTAAYGGAMINEVQNSGRIGNVSVMHCTFSGNTGSEVGGGIYNSAANSGTVNLAVSHCTFAGNTANLGSSLYNFAFSATATATLRNSIFATNGGANLFNIGTSMSSLGYNVCSDNGGGALTATGDKTNTNPLLAPLASNGGPTQTHALLPGSPALDNGRSFLLAFDQRGFARAADSMCFTNAPGGDGTDSGAFEVSPFGGIIDTDGDGMPDEFEVFFNLSDPNADMDGDGDSNVKEYQNGTDPCDNGSYLLRIISIVRNGNDVVIIFNAVAGKTYRLERKTLITDTDWMSIPEVPDLAAGATANAQFTHFGAIVVPNTFYRVRLLP